MASYDDEVDTPAFFVNLTQVAANCAKQMQIAQDSHVRLRPHFKTHKTIEIAKLQLTNLPTFQQSNDRKEEDLYQQGIIVSTLKEAEHLADHGFQDILYAVLVSPRKKDRIMALHQRIDRFHVLLDSFDTKEILKNWWIESAAHKPLNVFVKIDCGYHRAGIDPRAHEAIRLCQELHEDRELNFQGIYSHSGHSYNSPTGNAGAKKVAQNEEDVMADFTQNLKKHNVHAACVSVGSTPSCSVSIRWTGSNEIHPGNYVFYDRQQAASGSCTLGEVACYVGARVIGRYPDRNEFLVDAGASALHKDSAGIEGWGYIVGHPALTLQSVSQEVGIVGSSQPIDFDQFPLGKFLRILPNHSCMTACMHEEYQTVERVPGEDRLRITGNLHPCRGW